MFKWQLVFRIFLNIYHTCSQLCHVRRTRNSPTTCRPATTHAAPCLDPTPAADWTMLQWRAAAVRRELTWTRETRALQRQSVFATTTVEPRHLGRSLLMDASGELIISGFVLIKCSHFKLYLVFWGGFTACWGYWTISNQIFPYCTVLYIHLNEPLFFYCSFCVNGELNCSKDCGKLTFYITSIWHSILESH